MNDPVRKVLSYRFGFFEAQAASRQLLRKGTLVRLQEQPFQLLLFLLERPGELVTREQLRQKLWAADTFVDFDNSLRVAVKKLRDAIGDGAGNPRFVETVPRQGYRFIAPVLVDAAEVPPAQSAAAIFTDASARLSAPASVGPRPRAGRWLIAIVLVIAAAAFTFWEQSRWSRSQQAKVEAPIITPRRAIAVLGFRNTSGRPDAEWLSAAIAEMLSTELAAGSQLRLISGEDVANLKSTAQWPQADTLAQDTTRRVGTALGSNLLATGSYVLVGPEPDAQLRLDARIQDADSGSILAAVAESGKEKELFSLLQRTGDRLRAELSVPNPSVEQLAGVRASVSGNFEAQRFYSLGLERLRGYDALTARDLLEQAVKLDPKFPMAQWALANAWAALGYDKKAEAEAGKAFADSTHLPVSEKLLIEGFYRETQSRWKDAASAYRSLLALYPDSIDYGLRLFRAQRQSGDQMAAAETIKRLRRLPPPDSDNPRIDLSEARLMAGIDRSESLALAQTAVRKSQDRGLKLEYAHAIEEECIDLGWLGRPQEALRACNEAKRIYLAAGDRHDAAMTAWKIADRTSEQAQYPEALAFYEEALTDFRKSGSRANISAVLNNAGLVYEVLGDLARAGKMYEEAARLDREAGEVSNLTVVMVNVASVRSRVGDLRGGLKVAQQALALARSASTEGFVSESLTMLAHLQQMAGNLTDAHRLAEESVRLERKIGEIPDLTSALLASGDVLRAQGDFVAARKDYDEALGLSKQSKDADAAATLQLSLAELDLDEGRAGQAEPLARTALTEFTKEKAASWILRVQLAISRSLLMQSRTSEAKTVADEASVSARSVHEYPLILAMSAMRAEISAVASDKGAGRMPTQDLTKLKALVADAKRKGYFEPAARAQITLGKIQTCPNPSAANELLRRLEESCRARGYVSIAKQASALAGKECHPPASP